MNIPTDLRYTAEHEWVGAGDPATIGVTAVATDSLGDIVFLELPEVGRAARRAVAAATLAANAPQASTER